MSLSGWTWQHAEYFILNSGKLFEKNSELNSNQSVNISFMFDTFIISNAWMEILVLSEFGGLKPSFGNQLLLLCTYFVTSLATLHSWSLIYNSSTFSVFDFDSSLEIAPLYFIVQLLVSPWQRWQSFLMAIMLQIMVQISDFIFALSNDEIHFQYLLWLGADRKGGGGSNIRRHDLNCFWYRRDTFHHHPSSASLLSVVLVQQNT